MAKPRRPKWKQAMGEEGAIKFWGGSPTKGTGVGTRTGKPTQGEVSPLRQGQQNYIEGLKSGKGGTNTKKGSSYSIKSKSLKEQKVAKKKKSKDTWEQDAQKNKDLQRKQKKMEAEGRQNRLEREKQNKLYGDWLPVSKGAIKKRKAGVYKSGKMRKKKKKEEEKTTPYHHEGGSGE